MSRCRLCYLPILIAFLAGSVVGQVFLFNYLAFSGGTEIYPRITEHQLDKNVILELNGKYFTNFYRGSNDLDTNLDPLAAGLAKVYTNYQQSSYTWNDQPIYISYDNPHLIPMWGIGLIIGTISFVSLIFLVFAGCMCEMFNAIEQSD